jgi:transcription antitermination factor NusB
MKSRRACREAALQALYQFDTLGEFSADQLDFFLVHFQSQAQLDDDDQESRVVADQFCRELVSGVVSNIDAIDEAIARASVNWSVSRMARVDRTIIRLAAYEIMFVDDIPSKVSINEAIEVAKRFSAPEAPTFINGLLDKLAAQEQKPKR